MVGSIVLEPPVIVGLRSGSGPRSLLPLTALSITSAVDCSVLSITFGVITLSITSAVNCPVNHICC